MQMKPYSGWLLCHTKINLTEIQLYSHEASLRQHKMSTKRPGILSTLIWTQLTSVTAHTRETHHSERTAV